MEIAIDFESGVPIYTQIIDRIKQMVFSGQLQPGQQLPTIRQLATDLRINYNTVGRAYLILDQEGVISTQQGRGTFITTRLSEKQIQEMRMDKLESLLREVIHEALGLSYNPQEIERVFEQLIQSTSTIA